MLFLALLLLVAIGIQVRYAQAFVRSGVDVGIATKIVWVFNLVLLTAVAVGLAVYALQGGLG